MHLKGIKNSYLLIVYISYAIIYIISSAYVITAQSFIVKASKEIYMNLPELVEQYPNYSVQKHTIKTDDGYFISIFRINKGKLDYRKLPILMIHGMIGSAEDYVRMGPNRSLAFLLANEGYDVWLGNFRGNIYTSHEFLKKSDVKFWDFSMDEHGKYDLPPIITHVLKETGARKIHYLGFSMGTSAYFITCNVRPDLASKIASFTALAPVASLGDMVKPVATISLSLNIFTTLRTLKFDPLMFPSDVQRILASKLCTMGKAGEDICYALVLPVIGEDNEQVDLEKRPIIFARFQPATLRQLEHYSQMAVSDTFQEYDWGKNTNMLKYGYYEPRIYNVSKNIAPTTLYYGLNDDLASPSETIKLMKTLKHTNPMVVIKRLPYKKFNHLDFIYAKDIQKLINYDIVKTLNKMSDMLLEENNLK